MTRSSPATAAVQAEDFQQNSHLAVRSDISLGFPERLEVLPHSVVGPFHVTRREGMAVADQDVVHACTRPARACRSPSGRSSINVCQRSNITALSMYLDLISESVRERDSVVNSPSSQGFHAIRPALAPMGIRRPALWLGTQSFPLTPASVRRILHLDPGTRPDSAWGAGLGGRAGACRACGAAGDVLVTPQSK